MTLRERLWAWLGPPPAPQPIVIPPVTVSLPEPKPFVKGACVTCVFWASKDKSHGECHGAAPAVFDASTLNRPVVIWGLTSESDWCGAYRD